ncbi:MAG TPA: helix-turn-helix transcriptional regulator [Candidatus Binatia bacterium]|nr:helix-turn-helix transcriptional regulator [Candidatus Binatia bacterium]
MAFSGTRLRLMREYRRLKVADLARLTGLTEGGIQRIENGEIKNPRFDTVEILADKLNVTTGYFREEAGTPVEFPGVAIGEALKRYLEIDRREDIRPALERAAIVDNAPDTVVGWRAFVAMSVSAWRRGLPAKKQPVGLSLQLVERKQRHKNSG